MEEPKKITLLLNHPASATMILHVNKKKDYYHSTWPIEEVRKLGWEGKDEAVLCIHHCYDGDGKDPVGVVIELSPNQPKLAPSLEVKASPSPAAEASKSLKLCQACGQENEQPNLHCIHCGAPFPDSRHSTPLGASPSSGVRSESQPSG